MSKHQASGGAVGAWAIAALVVALVPHAAHAGEKDRAAVASGHAPHRTEGATKAHDARHGEAPRRAETTRIRADRPRSRPVAERKRSPAKHPAKGRRTCQRAAVTLERAEMHESSTLALSDCDGHARREAQIALSALARLRGTPKPKEQDFVDAADDGEVVDRGVALMHHGLVERLQRITERFPGKTIEIVSGFRPQSDGSMHQRGRAIDIHLTGVDNVALVELCRTFEDTGCGYYPNSSFVHVDVRPQGSGKVTWIDASGPGEAPRYVTSWPPKKCDTPEEPSTGDDPYTENQADAPERETPGAASEPRDPPR